MSVLVNYGRGRPGVLTSHHVTMYDQEHGVLRYLSPDEAERLAADLVREAAFVRAQNAAGARAEAAESGDATTRAVPA